MNEVYDLWKSNMGVCVMSCELLFTLMAIFG